jgi:hypothetical protein
LLGFEAFVFDQCGGYAHPAVPVEGADGHVGVGCYLLRHFFGVSGLEVKTTLIEVEGTENAYLRTIAVDGGDIVDSAHLQKIKNFIQFNCGVLIVNGSPTGGFPIP